MHQSMYENEIIKENIAKLEKKNVIFVNPTIEEGKAKIANIDSVLVSSINILKKSPIPFHNNLNCDDDTIQ